MYIAFFILHYRSMQQQLCSIFLGTNLKRVCIFFWYCNYLFQIIMLFLAWNVLILDILEVCLAFCHFCCSTGFAATRHCFQDLAGSIGTFQNFKFSYHLVKLLISICWWCSKCSRLLAMDKQSTLLLPPVHRPYWQFSFSKILLNISSKDQNSDTTQAYHIDCLSEET